MSVYEDALGYWYNTDAPGAIFTSQADAQDGQLVPGVNSPFQSQQSQSQNIGGNPTDIFGEMQNEANNVGGLFGDITGGNPYAQAFGTALGATGTTLASGINQLFGGSPITSQDTQAVNQSSSAITGSVITIVQTYGSQLLTIVIGIIVLAAGLFMLGKGEVVQSVVKEVVKP